MNTRAMLQDLLSQFKRQPERFTLRDGFILDDLKDRARQGYGLTPAQEEVVDLLYGQYVEAAAAARQDVN